VGAKVALDDFPAFAGPGHAEAAIHHTHKARSAFFVEVAHQPSFFVLYYRAAHASHRTFRIVTVPAKQRDILAWHCLAYIIAGLVKLVPKIERI